MTETRHYLVNGLAGLSVSRGVAYVCRNAGGEFASARGPMEYGTFKLWLTERGCRFDTQPEQRGDGHGTVTIHREGRTAELLLVGARHELDPNSVRRVCEALGLTWSDLPGPKSRA